MPTEDKKMSKRITKAEQRIIDLIAERPGLKFMAFRWYNGSVSAEERLAQPDSLKTIDIYDDGDVSWQSRTTLGVMIKLAKRGVVQSFDATDKDSYCVKTVLPIA